jgi:hypothetical protein
MQYRGLCTRLLAKKGVDDNLGLELFQGRNPCRPESAEPVGFLIVANAGVAVANSRVIVVLISTLGCADSTSWVMRSA